AVPTAGPCARLHVRHLLGEWGLNGLAANTELLTSELVTNAVQATAGQQQAAIRLRLSSDHARVLVEVWDADPRPPAPQAPGEDGTLDPEEEGGRGLFLVAGPGTPPERGPTPRAAGRRALGERSAGGPAQPQDRARGGRGGVGCPGGRCAPPPGTGTPPTSRPARSFGVSWRGRRERGRGQVPFGPQARNGPGPCTLPRPGPRPRAR